MKILIIKLSAIGDVIQALPALNFDHQNCRKVQIILLVEKWIFDERL